MVPSRPDRERAHSPGRQLGEVAGSADEYRDCAQSRVNGGMREQTTACEYHRARARAELREQVDMGRPSDVDARMLLACRGAGIDGSGSLTTAERLADCRGRRINVRKVILRQRLQVHKVQLVIGRN